LTELKEFLEANGKFDTMKSEDVSHTPYLSIIYRYLKEWQVENNKNDDDLPANFAEKQRLKHLIGEGMNHVRECLQSKDEARDYPLENFEEAIKAMNQVLVASKYIPPETKRVLEDAKAVSSDYPSRNKEFWLLIRALREFLCQSNGRLPLRGSLPDMTSDTNRYIELQNIYTNKSREDRESLAAIVKEMCIQAGQSTETVSENTLKIFCHSCHCLRLTRTQPIYEEYELDKHSARAARLREVITRSSLDGDLETDDLIFHLMIRSVCRFYTQYNRFPGSEQVESDVLTLKNVFQGLWAEFGCSRLCKDDFIHEMCRYGGSELHSVSAFVAGSVAQEVIKLITNQYTPLNSLLIYNAITSVTTAYEW
jgi:amyloid beta precursor protein binding protein 1